MVTEQETPVKRRRRTAPPPGPQPAWPADAEHVEVEEMDFEAVACVLANTCRWGGRTRRFLSLAQHGLIMSEEIEALDRLRVRGLMTMAAGSADAGAVRGCFRTLRRLFEELAPARPAFDTLSMGMSGDFEIAVEEGATLVRLGTVLFGPRTPAPPAQART